MGIALSEMKIDNEKKLVSFLLTKDFMTKNNIQKDETEGIVEKLLEYKDCEVGHFSLKEGKWKNKRKSKK